MDDNLSVYKVRGHGRDVDDFVVSTSVAQAALDYQGASQNRQAQSVEFLFRCYNLMKLGRLVEDHPLVALVRREINEERGDPGRSQSAGFQAIEEGFRALGHSLDG